jgi:RNA polymerase sigma-70 factor (ECF subfamily)
VHLKARAVFEQQREEDVRLIVQSLESPRVQNKLIARLDPLVRGPVRIALRRWRNGRIGNLDQDDLVSEVFAQLYADGGRDLKLYDPSRGTLENFISMYTRSRLRDLQKKEMRREKLFPAPGPMGDAAEELPHNGALPDAIIEAQQEAKKVRECLDKKMATPRAQEMVKLLIDFGLTTDDIVKLGFDRQAVFRWRSTILAAIRECWTIHERET